MRIQDMPWWNKPSNRIKRKGEDKLNPAELLSIIIWSGSKGENAIDMSNRLLKKHSLNKLSQISLTELEKEVGKIGAVRIKAMYEIFKLTNWVKRKGFKPTIERAKDVYNQFVDELREKKKEHLYALLLDAKNRVITEELVTVGTLNSSLIHPREVFREAIKHSANSIILVHNHPDDDITPSEEDKEATSRIKMAGDLIGIKLVDHIIISGNSYFSFDEKKLL